jgi:hypothetical protein
LEPCPTLEFIIVDDANKEVPHHQVIPATGDCAAQEKVARMVDTIKSALF